MITNDFDKILLHLFQILIFFMLLLIFYSLISSIYELYILHNMTKATAYFIIALGVTFTLPVAYIFGIELHK